MLQQAISRLFRAQHYWRSISFDEIAELYVSRLLTVFAANIVSTFAIIYLYTLGYSVLFIATFFGLGFVFKVFFSVPAAQYAAFVGPKHGILLANIMRVPTLVAFALVPEYGLPAVLVFGLFQHMSNTLYDLCYMIDFSKVRNISHTGKELGTMQVIEKVARVLSPLLGGIIATLYSPQAAILIACGLFIGAALPLFRTVEPTIVRRRLYIKGFPWRLAWRSLCSEIAVGFDFSTSGLAWSLWLGVFVFGALGSGVYAAMGGLASLGVLVSMVAAWTFGSIIDRRKGHILLTIGAVLNSTVHVFRSFVSTPAGVVAANIANETATSAYAMPFMRVTFDIADRSGFRITYLMLIEMALNTGAALACGVIVVALFFVDQQAALQTLFAVAAGVGLLLLFSRRLAK
jgi:hypothetical protein